MSAAKQIAAELTTQLLTQHAGIVSRLWLPSFEAEDLVDARITVRPASRIATRQKQMADREVGIEIGVVQMLPANATANADPYNNLAVIDAFDLLSETVLDHFLPDGGFLADVPICGYRPRSVEQLTLVDAELLRTKRQLLTIIIVTYQRLG